jgi:hypothetical protein
MWGIFVCVWCVVWGVVSLICFVNGEIQWGVISAAITIISIFADSRRIRYEVDSCRKDKLP